LNDTEPLSVTSPRGVTTQLYVRPDTNDAATLHSTFWAPGFPSVLHDEYGLADLYLEGWALDIGAHIGSVAIALALDNPTLRVLAVEAVPQNALLLEGNTRLAMVSDRVTVVSAAAGNTIGKTVVHYGHYDVPGIPEDHAREARYIGNLFRSHGKRGLTVTVPCVNLEGLLNGSGIDEVAFMKIDCEGCEWDFLPSPAIARVRVIVGEYHERGWRPMRDLLASTHDFELLHEDGGFGLFRAVRH
jgi:FkbM family methyltransferase